MNFFTKKTHYLLPLVFLTGIAAFLFLLLSIHKNDQRIFTAISEELFTGEMTANTLNMHFTIAYPEDYDISYLPVLSVYQPDRSSNNLSSQDALLSRLEKISPKRLSPSDAYAYDLLVSYLRNQRTGNHLYLYEEPLSPASGAQSKLPILLAEYTFRTATDVEDYLAILNQIDDFLAGLVLFEQERAAAGLFMSDVTVDKVIEQCDNIMNKEQLLAGSHFLQTTFRERVESLAADGIISTERKNDSITENNRLLLDVVQPAYEQTGDQMYLLKGSGRNNGGLSYYPDGQEYYQYLLRSNTGSYRDMESIKQLLYQDFKSNFNQLIALTSAHTDLADEIKKGPLALPLTEPADILRDLQSKIMDSYPALPAVTGSDTPSCAVKNVSPSMEPYSSPAYYLTPPIDCYGNNTIYINQKHNPDSLSLYTTLAHEGYPGHLYQTVFYRMYMEKTGGNRLRHILNYSGYQEGWALYVEMDSFRYARQLTAGTAPNTSHIYEYYRLNHSLQLGLYSLLDIAIHYDGADFQQVQKILRTIGISDDEAILGIYEYIVEEPTNYLKYYLGYLEILELKREARKLWGKEYSDYEFHRFFLEAGPSDFTNLKKRLRITEDVKSDAAVETHDIHKATGDDGISLPLPGHRVESTVCPQLYRSSIYRLFRFYGR